MSLDLCLTINIDYFIFAKCRYTLAHINLYSMTLPIFLLPDYVGYVYIDDACQSHLLFMYESLYWKIFFSLYLRTFVHS